MGKWHVHLGSGSNRGSLRTTAGAACGARQIVGVLAVFSASVVAGEAPGEQPAARARPPAWSLDVRELFFDDATDEVDGERPDYAALNRQTDPNRQAAIADPQATSVPGGEWSGLVSADTLETEIKRLARQVADDVTAPTPFKGGGYQNCRRHFSMLAVLFAVTAEFDGSVRWHDSAAGLRELFARAGYNCKTGTDQTFREASQRKQDLADLVRGSRPETPEAEQQADWYEVADRSPLMERMEQSHQQGLTRWLASSNEFKRHRDDVVHEAELLSVLAEVIQQEGFDFWDDETYLEYAGQLRDAAHDVAQAAQQENLDAARSALGRATKACSNCHENYRG